MQRVLLAVALVLIFAVTGWSQDSETTPAGEEVEQEAADVEEEADEEIDDSDLDDQSYADIEDDDFRPSEDIPADQSIPFPTDI